MRLQKFLSSAGVCSRRQGERLIQAGRVRVNGKRVTELGSRVDPQKDRVDVDGYPAEIQRKSVYIALNKPKGYVTSCLQPGDRTVMELLDIPQRVYPVGRLDKDSTGLLILTSDGRLHHRLSHPSFDHVKVYEVTVKVPITTGALEKIAGGVPMMGTRTRPAGIKRISSRRFQMSLKEGKKQTDPTDGQKSRQSGQSFETGENCQCPARDAPSRCMAAPFGQREGGVAAAYQRLTMHGN